MTEKQWLKNSQIGIDIWEHKYKQGDETFELWLDRVSGGNLDIRQLITERKFLFGGRILSNRGMGQGVTYSNCYVIAPPEDNIESIYDCAKKLARTFSYGGGVGIDIGKLRPKNGKVNNSAKVTSGSVSFMDLYSITTELIGQNGRRGALMISIPCNHPDLEDFINLKSDLNKVTKANISVRITEDFMEAVKSKSKYVLEFLVDATNEHIAKEIDAYEMFQKLCNMNWDYAEPGVLFWDKIEKWNLLSATKDFKFAGTNPCLTGDTLINTTRGVFPIRELIGTSPDVYCMDDKGELIVSNATKVWKTRTNATILKITTPKGEIKCTPDHKIFTRNRGWVEAQYLKKGDKLVGLNRQMSSERHVSVGLTGSKYIAEHRLIAGYYQDILDKDIHHIDDDTLNNNIDNLQVLSHSEHSKITNTGRKIEVNRDSKGRYIEKNIKASRKSFNLNKPVGANWFVQNVEWLTETEDVYDMTVPIHHNFVANNIVVHNCAEEPLPEGGSCLLGSLNLSEFVKDNKFDFDDFAQATRIATIGLNEVLDEGLSLHPLEEQRNSVRDWRQIGLGIMGLADMLIKLKIEYGSKESLDLCGQIADTMIKNAFIQSISLGEEIGSFPMFKEDNVTKTDFYKSNLSGIECNELCNSQLLTIAPTGSLSTMLGISGGIEPIFANYYTRKTESLHGEDKYYKVFTPIVEEYFADNNISPDDALLPDYFITAQTLNFKKRIDMQSVWQQRIDASISSTVNVPNSFTQDEVVDLYMYAYDKGLKGVTIYRDGCKRSGILTTDDPINESTTELRRGDIVKVDDDVIGLKRKLMTGCGSLHCTAFFDKQGDLVETYLSKGSTGGCNNFMIGLSRMISLSARAGVKIEDIVDQLNSCGVCPSYAVRKATKNDTSKGSCCPIAIGNVLLDMYNEIKQSGVSLNKITQPENTSANNPCPQCGEQLVAEGGCNICKSCGK